MFIYFILFIVLGVFICANLVAGILFRQILRTGILSDSFTNSNEPSKLKPIISKSISTENLTPQEIENDSVSYILIASNR